MNDLEKQFVLQAGRTYWRPEGNRNNKKFNISKHVGTMWFIIGGFASGVWRRRAISSYGKEPVNQPVETDCVQAGRVSVLEADGW